MARPAGAAYQPVRSPLTGFAVASVFGLCLGGMALAMALAFSLRRATGNSGWIDVTWTFAVGAVGAAISVWASGASLRGVVVALCALAWSARLGGHIARRTLRSGDDPRYRKLEEGWGAHAATRLFLFLQAQALVGAFLALCIALVGLSRFWPLRDALAAMLFFSALGGEALADAQLDRFKSDARNGARICDTGLWSRSRHPNYFFEWLTWVAAALAALDPWSSGAWSLIALAAPMLMYWTLRYASGVPPVEERMAATRGDAFQRYKAKTPEFFPRLWR
jgi:steroid 5-alpha reductase family enzyme